MRRLLWLCLLISSGIILLAFPRFASASVSADTEAWLRLRDPRTCYAFAEYRRLIDTHPDWPETPILRVQAEQALNDNPPQRDIILAWLGKYPPVGDNGRFLYFNTLVQNGDMARAKLFLNDMWALGAFNATQQDAIIGRYGNWISNTARHARVDALLWANNTQRAEKALNYVGSQARAIGLSRLALQRLDGRATVNLPSQNDAGLNFDLARYYRQKGFDGRAAIALSRATSKSLATYSALWWKERSLLARRALERDDFPTAYHLASKHGFDTGPELADAEWLAGWLALTRLDRADTALRHFMRMATNVKSPISVARANYWAGMAAAKTGDMQRAKQFYRVAAQHMHVFYGQMAAYALQGLKDGDVAGYYATFFKRNTRIPAASLRHSLIDAASYLHKKGFEKERDQFLATLLAQNKDAPHQVIPIARSLRSEKVSLTAAKAAYEKNKLIGDALFPKLNVPRNAEVETALTLGIIRQESMFDPYAQSPARAMGLMQILPGTANDIARKKGIAHRSTAQLFDPRHNMVLGQAYLGSMLARYGGDVPLAAAAYNAGPGNVDKWVAAMGDPNTDPRSWIDWVERIPFYETRNYVQRVWEAYQVYKYILATD